MIVLIISMFSNLFQFLIGKRGLEVVRVHYYALGPNKRFQFLIGKRGHEYTIYEDEREVLGEGWFQFLIGKRGLR